MNQQMTDREAKMHNLQAYNFAMAEVALFLDTHPDDKVALSYFKKYGELKDMAEKEFTSSYGPITTSTTNYDFTTWNWIDNPWPWEREGEV